MEVLDEVTTLVSKVKKETTIKEEVNVAGEIDISVGSIINSLMFGYALHGVRLQTPAM